MVSTVYQEGMYFLDFGSGFSSGAAFTPSDLPNLAAWFRADDLTTSGSSVTQWNDKGLSGYHLTPGNSPTLLSSVAAINNQPAVRFNGSTNYLENATLSQADGYHTFIIFARQGGGVVTLAIIDSVSQAGDALYYVSNPSLYTIFSGSNLTYTPAVPDNTWTVGDGWWQSTNSEINVNNGTPSVGNTGSVSSTGFRVGRRGNPSTAYGQLDIAEIIVSTAKISGDNLTNLHGYLNSRYGFSN